MGKSFKKFPATGWADNSDKMCKRFNNRIKRSNLKQQIRQSVILGDPEEDYLATDFEPKRTRMDNPWCWAKDGKARILRGKDPYSHMDDDEFDELDTFARRK